MKIEKKDGDKKFKKNTPRDFVSWWQHVETVMWLAKWIDGEFAQGTKYKDLEERCSHTDF